MNYYTQYYILKISFLAGLANNEVENHLYNLSNSSIKKSCINSYAFSEPSPEKNCMHGENSQSSPSLTKRAARTLLFFCRF